MTDPTEYKQELSSVAQSLNLEHAGGESETQFALLGQMKLKNLVQRFSQFDLKESLSANSTSRDQYQLVQYIFRSVGIYLARKKSIFTNLGEDLVDKEKLRDFNLHYFRHFRTNDQDQEPLPDGFEPISDEDDEE